MTYGELYYGRKDVCVCLRYWVKTQELSSWIYHIASMILSKLFDPSGHIYTTTAVCWQGCSILLTYSEPRNTIRPLQSSHQLLASMLDTEVSRMTMRVVPCSSSPGYLQAWSVDQKNAKDFPCQIGHGVDIISVSQLNKLQLVGNFLMNFLSIRKWWCIKREIFWNSQKEIVSQGWNFWPKPQ